MTELLRQQFELGYTYTRSTGPVVGAFLSGLRDRSILGTLGSDGTVYVPPMEFDPPKRWASTSRCPIAVRWGAGAGSASPARATPSSTPSPGR